MDNNKKNKSLEDKLKEKNNYTDQNMEVFYSSIRSIFEVAKENIDNFATFTESMVENESFKKMMKLATILDELEKENGIKQDDLIAQLDNFESLNDLSALSNLNKDEIRELLKKDIPKLKSIHPNNFSIPNNKLANEMTKDLLGIGDVALSVGRGKKEVLTTVNINYDSEGIQIYNKAERFTAYDRVVHNAVCSLFMAGNGEITPAMVYRCMNGLKNKEKVSPQAVGAVTKSLDKVSRIRCVIDWSAEARARGFDCDFTKLEGNILATEKITVSTGGNIVTAYKILNEPVLYRYAKALKQVITIPVNLLNTKEVTRSTDEVIIIREYLIRRIEVMKKDAHKSNNILYQSVFEEIGVNDSIGKQAFADKTKKIRKTTKELLSYWKEGQYIKDFKEYKEGKSFKGITIFY